MQISLKPRHRMTLWGVLLVGLTLMPISAWSGSSNQNPANGIAPRAVFPQIRYDFHSVMEGVQIKHDFYIENTGKAPLMIEKVRPS